MTTQLSTMKIKILILMHMSKVSYLLVSFIEDTKLTTLELPLVVGCTMRANLLNWSNLVSISKNLVLYAFGVVRIC